jgi:hypothetical protein
MTLIIEKIFYRDRGQNIYFKRKKQNIYILINSI